MTSGEITAITLASISAFVAVAPHLLKYAGRRLGRADKTTALQNEIEDLRREQAKCNADRRNDRRLMRWVILQVIPDGRASNPPGPVARALADLFSDDTAAEGAAE